MRAEAAPRAGAVPASPPGRRCATVDKSEQRSAALPFCSKRCGGRSPTPRGVPALTLFSSPTGGTSPPGDLPEAGEVAVRDQGRVIEHPEQDRLCSHNPRGVNVARASAAIHGGAGSKVGRPGTLSDPEHAVRRPAPSTPSHGTATRRPPLPAQQPARPRPPQPPSVSTPTCRAATPPRCTTGVAKVHTAAALGPPLGPQTRQAKAKAKPNCKGQETSAPKCQPKVTVKNTIRLTVQADRSLTASSVVRFLRLPRPLGPAIPLFSPRNRLVLGPEEVG